MLQMNIFEQFNPKSFLPKEWREKSESILRAEKFRVEIDDGHELAVLGGEEADKKENKLQREPLDIAIMNIKNGGESVRFSKLLREINPKCFIYDSDSTDRFTYNSDEKNPMITISPNKIQKDVRRVFSVLHEMGHASKHLDRDEEEQVDQLLARGAMELHENLIP